MINSNGVQSIVIKNEKDTGDVVIKNRALIASLCKSLKSAKPAGDDFLKNTRPMAVVTINLADGGSMQFGVKTKVDTTVLTVNSNGASGWHYGNLKADNFGRLLHNVIKRHGFNTFN